MRMKLRKKHILQGFLTIFVIVAVSSIFYPCMPSGIFYNPLFDCLHDGSHSYFIMTKHGIVYLLVFEEKEPKVLTALNGRWHRRDDGRIKVDSMTNARDGSQLDVALEIQTYWWGMKAFADDRVFYGFRLPEVNIYTILENVRNE